MARELAEAYRPASRYKVGDEIHFPDWRRITAIREQQVRGQRYLGFTLDGEGDREVWFSPTQTQWHRRCLGGA